MNEDHQYASYIGYVAQTADALRLIRQAIKGVLRIHRVRPPENVRNRIIYSGAVYIFEEGEMHRWTDGRTWSPSRALGNFMIYREVDRSSRHEHVRPAGRQRQESPFYENEFGVLRTQNIELSIYGALVDTHPFVENGLVKKTFVAHYGERILRLVSYYTAEDVLNHRLVTPYDDRALPPEVPDPLIDDFVVVPRMSDESQATPVLLFAFNQDTLYPFRDHPPE